jgi:hypothetical protein
VSFTGRIVGWHFAAASARRKATLDMTDGTAARLVAQHLGVIEDFPKAGITFRDLTPVFADGPALAAVTRALVEPFVGEEESAR